MNSTVLSQRLGLSLCCGTAASVQLQLHSLQAALCRHSSSTQNRHSPYQGATQVYLERSVSLLLKWVTWRMGKIGSDPDPTHGEMLFLFWQSCRSRVFVLCLLHCKSFMATLLPGVMPLSCETHPEEQRALPGWPRSLWRAVPVMCSPSSWNQGYSAQRE